MISQVVTTLKSRGQESLLEFDKALGKLRENYFFDWNTTKV